jgi:hypothetical protein
MDNCGHDRERTMGISNYRDNYLVVDSTLQKRAGRYWWYLVPMLAPPKFSVVDAKRIKEVICAKSLGQFGAPN